MAHPSLPPPSSPVTATKILDLSSYCHGTSRYLGSAEVSMSANGHICVVRRVDNWTQPTVFVLDLANPKTPVLASPIALHENDPAEDRKLQCKISLDGGWLALYAGRRVWLAELTAESRINSAPPIECSGSPVRLVAWTRDSQAAVVLNNGKILYMEPKTYGFEDDYTTVWKEVQHMVGYFTSEPSEESFLTTRTSLWAGKTNVRFENGHAVGSIRLSHMIEDKVEEMAVSAFAGAFRQRTTDSSVTFIYANTGTALQSLTICSVQYPDTPGSSWTESVEKPLWKQTFHQPRTHDLTSPDIPIALHISEENGLVYVVTTLSYVHVFQVATGSHVGSHRVSTYRISASALSKDKKALLLVDANGMVFEVGVDINGWLSQLNIPTRDAGTKRQALRVVLQNDIPITQILFFEFFPNFTLSNTQAYHDAVELLEPLTGDELLTFFIAVLKENSLLMTFTRMLSKRFSERIPLANLVGMFKLYGGAAAVLPFLNLLGVQNLTGTHVTDYVQAVVDMQQYEQLERFLQKEKIADPSAVQEVLMEAAKSHSEVAALLERFCIRYNMMEGLVEYLMTTGANKFSHLTAIKKLIEKADSDQVLQIFAALFKSSTADGLLDAFLTVVKTTAFTSELVALFRQHNKVRNCVKHMESILTQPGSSGDLMRQLLTVYEEDTVDGATKKVLFFQLIGTARAEEIGNALKETDHQLALSIYKSGECDWAYIKLATDHNLVSDVISYLLDRGNITLWTQVLSGQGRPDLDGLYTSKLFHTAGFHTQLLHTPFPAVSALLIALIEGSHHQLARHIVEYLVDVPFAEKAERCFIQNCYLKVMLSFYPQDSEVISNFIADHEDFNAVRLLTDLLARKMVAPAQTIIDRLADSGMTDEVTGEEVDALARVAVSSGTKSVWRVVGNLHLERDRLKEALLAYIQGEHHENYVHVLKAIKNEENCEYWNIAINYMKMVKRFVRDAKGLNITLGFALAKTNRLAEFEQLVASAAANGRLDEKMCRICEDAPMETVFLPCGHGVTCVGCSRKVTICPICREKITAAQRVFIT